MKTSIKVGISACVLGEEVRFDSGHKASKFVTNDLSSHFEFVPTCPEVAIGLTVPRPAIRLVSNAERIALVESKNNSIDYTNEMLSYSKSRVQELNHQSLCGYIVCAKSPTCGMERVKVYGSSHDFNGASTRGGSTHHGVGLFTQELISQMPWLPVEEDGRLNDPVLKENFITRVYTLHDFYQSMGEVPTRGKLVAFHSRYKLSLMAHNPVAYRKLGQLVAEIKNYDIDEFYTLYRTQFMSAMAKRASRKNNTNVLMHLQGYFKRDLATKQKVELRQVIEEYRIGQLPLLAPLTLIKHYLSAHPDSYLLEQKYLEPYPQELRLRYGL